MSGYEFDGKKYKEASKYQKEVGNSLISDLELNGDEVILDLGCGEGVLTERISALVPRGKVIGIDASSGMINEAKKLEKDNLSFVLADINKLDYVDSFDIIYSNAALHWVKNHSLLLKNSYAALKTGGRIYWGFAGDGNCPNFISAVKAEMADEKYKEYFRGFEWPWFMPAKSEYEELTAGIGFSESEIRFEDKGRYFVDQDEMIKWIDQPCIVPFIAPLPDSVKQSFRDAVVETMTEITKRTDGRYYEPFMRISVKARRQNPPVRV